MTEHNQQADHLEDEADTLEQRSDELGKGIAAAKQQVEELRQDDSVPTADRPAESGELPPPDPHETD